MSEEILIKGKCDFNKFQRLKFFHGMLLDDKDFTTEQQYFIEKRKLHNRMLHGWGIVCGLDIEAEPGRNYFVVKPGMALDCQGNEILVCNDTTVDMSDSSCSSINEKKVPLTPEECEELAKRDDTSIERWIGIRYNENGTAPVPVYIPGDECGQQDCAHSRIKEGFCIDILDKCPEENESGYGIHSTLLSCMNELRRDVSTHKPQSTDHYETLCVCLERALTDFCQGPTPCPDCCSDSPYIGLGKIILGPKNCIKQIRYDRCRQHVLGSYLTRYTLAELCGAIGLLLKKCSRMKKMEDKIEHLQERIEKLGEQYK